MLPSEPHAPPRPYGASAMTWAVPPATSTTLSFPLAKNARDRLSKDQKGKIAPSGSASSCASRELVGRTQIVLLPSASAAAKAIAEPSGEMIGGPALSPVRLMWVLSGGLMTERMLGTGVERCEKNPAIAPRRIPATTAKAQARERRPVPKTGVAVAAGGGDFSGGVPCRSRLVLW